MKKDLNMGLENLSRLLWHA